MVEEGGSIGGGNDRAMNGFDRCPVQQILDTVNE